MGDIDQALARAYARRGPAESPPARRPRPTSRSSPRPGRSGPRRPGLAARRSGALEREHGDRFDRLADALVAARDRQQHQGRCCSRAATAPRAGRPWS